MSPTSKKPTKDKLTQYAAAVRKELELRSQEDVFVCAVQLGYLAARADGGMDEAEKQRIVEAVDVLSQGTVIELEVESIIEEAEAADADEATTIAELGARMKKLGHADTGLLFAAFVAQASAGIDKHERSILREVGKAAGLKDNRIRSILKVVGAEGGED
jgi:tellurite resistance protein